MVERRVRWRVSVRGRPPPSRSSARSRRWERSTREKVDAARGSSMASGTPSRRRTISATRRSYVRAGGGPGSLPSGRSRKTATEGTLPQLVGLAVAERARAGQGERRQAGGAFGGEPERLPLVASTADLRAGVQTADDKVTHGVEQMLAAVKDEELVADRRGPQGRP